MSAVIALSEKEKAEIRKACFEECKKDSLIVLDAINCDHNWLQWYALSDFISMGKTMDRVLWVYLEKCGLFDKAEQDALSSKTVNGKSYYTA